MSAELAISLDTWNLYLGRSRSTVALRCSPDGRIREHNACAARLFGQREPLADRKLTDYLRRADQIPLDLDMLGASAEHNSLALIASPSGKLLYGFFFAEDDGVLLLADVLGEGDEVAEQLGMLTNEISDIGRELRQRNRELEEANRKITELSRTDPLTGLANRRRFFERLDPLLALARRRDLPLCLVMADLDRFKQINDTHGHEAGDEVLCAFADLLRRECRREDLPCRFGGEEFLVLLPYTRADEGLVLAERIRSRFAATRHLDGNVTVTASFGLADARPEDTAQTFVARADQAMYLAKAGGRNCTVTV